jgi:hypothetical protein
MLGASFHLHSSEEADPRRMRKGHAHHYPLATTLSLDHDAGSLPGRENIAIIILPMRHLSPADQEYCITPFVLLRRASEIFSRADPLEQSHERLKPTVPNLQPYKCDPMTDPKVLSVISIDFATVRGEVEPPGQHTSCRY